MYLATLSLGAFQQGMTHTGQGLSILEQETASLRELSPKPDGWDSGRVLEVQKAQYAVHEQQ
jgi:hypothetical protein